MTPQHFFTTGQTWTNMPAAETELLATTSHRRRIDLQGAAEARFKARVHVAGFAGAEVRPKFSTDDSTFTDLAATAGNLDILIDSTGTKETSWQKIAAGAQVASVILAVFGVGGNGTADPQFGGIVLEFR